MRFDTKIAIAVRADLQQWQKLNVTAFLASGIAAIAESIGKPYARPTEPLPGAVPAARGGMEGDRRRAAAHQRAARRGMPMAIYTMDMFTTGNDDDNRAVVARSPPPN